MAKYRVLLNPTAGNGRGREALQRVLKFYPADTLQVTDITSIDDKIAYWKSIPEDEQVLLIGGDGTLSLFADAIYGDIGDREVLYYPAGTGNDFWRDIGQEPGGKPAPVAKYLQNLPRVTVNGRTRHFLNGIGYGIDGYCCEVGDKLREKGEQNINYAGIAIKGLLFHYKATNADITVDGQTQHFSKVWIAPTMKGRFYGGGMMPTPAQMRLQDDMVSTMVMYGGGRLRTLMAFPGIFKGEHVKHTDMVKIMRGKSVRVAFDRPVALQIDGETVLNVSEYSVQA